MSDDTHLEAWKRRRDALRERLLHPEGLTRDEHAGLQSELRDIERLVSDLSPQTPA
jgi:hypothetical protein